MYGAREAEGRVRAIADLRRLLWRRGQGGGEIADLMGWCGAREGRFKGVVLSQRGRDTGPRTRPQGLTSHMRVVFNLLRMYPQKRGWDWIVRVLRNLILLRLFPKRISVMNPSGRFFSPGHNICLPVTHAHVFARMPYAVRRYGQISCGESFACHTGKLLLISQSVTHSLSQSPTHSLSESFRNTILHTFARFTCHFSGIRLVC